MADKLSCYCLNCSFSKMELPDLNFSFKDTIPRSLFKRVEINSIRWCSITPFYTRQIKEYKTALLAINFFNKKCKE